MKKRLAVAAATLMFAGLGAGVVQAEPGPNGKNDHGICTAYFNGQKKGHEQGNSPGPFGALEDANDDDIQAIFDFCTGVEKGIGGNPDENGRFTDCFTDGDGEEGNDCTDGDPEEA
jgi:hypothetical protein